MHFYDRIIPVVWIMGCMRVVGWGYLLDWSNFQRFLMAVDRSGSCLEMSPTQFSYF